MLRAVDPLLYALLVVAAFLPKGILRITPLQVEGTVTGLVFPVGLAMVWLAFVQRADEQADSPTGDRSDERAVRGR